MEWKQLSKNEAQVITNQWADNMDTFKKGLAGWAQRLENEQPESYKSLRKDILVINVKIPFKNKKDINDLDKIEFYKCLELSSNNI